MALLLLARVLLATDAAALAPQRRDFRDDDAPAPDERFAWLLEFRGLPADTVVADPRFAPLVQSRLPAPLNARVREGLSGAADPLRVQEGRYVSVSACALRSCRTKAFFWLDVVRGVGFGAHLDPGTRTLSFGSNGFSGREFPEALTAALNDWIRDRVVEGPEPGFGVAPGFDELVTRITFVDVQGRVSDLDRAAFAPPAFRPPPGGPAFPCRAADTPTENAICSDPELSRLDLRIFEQYTRLRDRDPSVRYQEALLDFQRAWIVRRDLTCRTAPDLRACLLSSYRTQSERLESWTPD